MQKIIQTLLILLFSVQMAHAQMNDTTMREYRLSNGLKLVVKVDRRAPVVLSEIWYKVGSGYEYSGITGISHALEHMMFKGTPTYPEGVFSKLIAENGGQQNAMTGQDSTMYYEELSAEKLPLAFKLEADRMQNLSLTDKAFYSELKVVQEERKLRIENDPTMLTYEQFNAAAFVNNPYHNPTAGWDNDLKQMTVADLRQWYKLWYAPNNAVLIVIGDVDPEKVYQLAQQYFGSIKSHPLPQTKNFHLSSMSSLRKVTVAAPAELPSLFLGFNVPSATSLKNSDDPYALDLLATILGGKNSSRLQKNLIRGKELASDIVVQYDLYTRLPSLFLIVAVPAEGVDLEKLKAGLFAEINTLKTRLISPEELERFKTQVIANRIYAEDSLDFQGTVLGTLESIGFSWHEVDNYETHIKNLTSEQLRSAAQKYLTENNMTQADLKPIAIEKRPGEPSPKQAPTKEDIR